MFIYCCGFGDCDLGKDLPVISGFGYEDYLLSFFCHCSINSSCDSCELCGPRTSISNLACKSIMGASGGDLFSLLFPLTIVALK